MYGPLMLLCFVHNDQDTCWYVKLRSVSNAMAGAEPHDAQNEISKFHDYAPAGRTSGKQGCGIASFVVESDSQQHSDSPIGSFFCITLLDWKFLLKLYIFV